MKKENDGMKDVMITSPARVTKEKDDAEGITC